MRCPRPDPAPVESALQALVLQQIPWQQGGLDPTTGLGCYGLVRWAYQHAGICLPETAELATPFFAIVPPPYEPFDLAFMRFASPAEARHVGLFLTPPRGYHCSWLSNGVARFSLHDGLWRRVFQHGLRYKAFLCD